MKTKEEIRDWLLENAVDHDGDLMLENLDFSDFDGDVYIDCMKVKGDLTQSYQEVKGNLYNRYNKYGVYLYEEPSTKLLKEVTLEELAEMGYTLKEEN